MMLYFAGLIRKVQVDAALLFRMIAFIQKTDSVLTGHVGTLSLQKSTSDTSVYARHHLTEKTDVLIGKCTCPALSIGYKLAYVKHAISQSISSTTERKCSCSPF